MLSLPKKSHYNRRLRNGHPDGHPGLVWPEVADVGNRPQISAKIARAAPPQLDPTI
jgi:hypothetical protein